MLSKLNPSVILGLQPHQEEGDGLVTTTLLNRKHELKRVNHGFKVRITRSVNATGKRTHPQVSWAWSPRSFLSRLCPHLPGRCVASPQSWWQPSENGEDHRVRQVLGAGPGRGFQQVPGEAEVRGTGAVVPPFSSMRKESRVIMA